MNYGHEPPDEQLQDAELQALDYFRTHPDETYTRLLREYFRLQEKLGEQQGARDKMTIVISIDSGNRGRGENSNPTVENLREART